MIPPLSVAHTDGVREDRAMPVTSHPSQRASSREILDHVIVLNNTCCERLLREFIHEYYHMARPHQGLDGEAPIPPERAPTVNGPAKLVSIPVPGGLHHRYERVAA